MLCMMFPWLPANGATLTLGQWVWPGCLAMLSPMATYAAGRSVEGGPWRQWWVWQRGCGQAQPDSETIHEEQVIVYCQ